MTYLARRFLAPCAILASLALPACQSKPAVCSAPQGAQADTQALAQADTAFALAFYPPAAAAAGAGKNVILSPHSVSSALAMLDVGAAGETDTQIRTVLGIPGGGGAGAPAHAALACADETDGTTNDNQLSIANALSPGATSSRRRRARTIRARGERGSTRGDRGDDAAPTRRR
jgi:hypothetical protein